MTTNKKERKPYPGKYTFARQRFLLDAEETSSDSIRITMAGVKHIQRYTENEMVFSFQELNICINGEELFCRAYQNGRMELTGRVENILFHPEEKAE